MLACQHSNSGSPAAHFTSASFRCDAKEDAAAMVNIFHKTTSAHMHAKRSEAVSLGRELEEIKEQISNLHSELAERNLE